MRLIGLHRSTGGLRFYVKGVDKRFFQVEARYAVVAANAPHPFRFTLGEVIFVHASLDPLHLEVFLYVVWSAVEVLCHWLFEFVGDCG